MTDDPVTTSTDLSHELTPQFRKQYDEWRLSPLRGLAERDQPAPAGAVTDLRQTLDAQLEILGELFDTAVHPNVTMRRKTQAVDQFRIALRFVRMLAAER